MIKSSIFLKALLVAFIATSITACGGDNSSSKGKGDGDNPKLVNGTITGQVIDPEIEGSVVKVCKVIDLTDCLPNTTVTNHAGGFNLTISDEIVPADYLIIGEGGVDAITGEDFTGVQFSVPLEAYQANTSTIISPVTSLVSQEVIGGKSLAEAKQAVAQRLDLTEAEVMQSPMDNIKVLQNSLVLSMIAKSRDNGLEGLTGTSNINSLLNDLDNDDSKASLKVFKQLVDNADSESAIINKFIILRDMLASDLITEEMDLSNAITRDNVSDLVSSIDTFLVAEGIDQVNSIQVKRVLTELKAGNEIDLSAGAYVSPAIVSSGVDYASLTVNRLINHKVDATEAIANTSDAKRDYYFGSTASYLYQAEQIMSNITDGNTLGEVYTNISKAYINAGQPERAIQLASRKLFNPADEADILSRAVNKQISLATNDSTSIANLDKAFSLTKDIITAKGELNIKSSDSKLLRQIFVGYKGIGDEEKQTNFNDYMAEIKDEFGDDDYHPYANISTGLYMYAEELAEQGKDDAARDTLASAVAMIENMPANFQSKYPTKPSKWYYKAKVFLYAKLAQVYYWDLGTEADKTEAIRLIGLAMEIRADDGIQDNGSAGSSKDTSCKTDFYVANYMFPIKADNGLTTQQATDFIDTLCKSSYKAQAWRSAAIAESATDIDAAIATIDDKFTSSAFKGNRLYRAKMDALTYNGKNRGGEYIALKLIKAGQMDDAKKAIDSAKTILEAGIADGEETKDSDKARYYIERGYTKLGELYYLAGFPVEAAEMYAKSEAVLSGADSAHANAVFTDEEKIAEQYIMLARSFAETKQIDKLESTITTTIAKAQAITDAGDKVDLLEDLLEEFSKPYLKSGVVELKPAMLTASDTIFEIATGATPIDSDSNQEDILKRLPLLENLVNSYQDINEYDKANLTITKYREYAELIASESRKNSAYQKVVKLYASLGQIDNAVDFVNDKLETKQEQLESLTEIADQVRQFDAFVTCKVANVDSDQDGKPDFYTVGATEEQIAECGLTLDDDSDNDDELDGTDLTPFYNKAS